MSLGDTVLQHFRELASLAPRRQSCYVRREGAAGLGCHAGDELLVEPGREQLHYHTRGHRRLGEGVPQRVVHVVMP